MALWMVVFISGHLTVLTLASLPGGSVGALAIAMAGWAAWHRRTLIAAYLAGIAWAIVSLPAPLPAYAEGDDAAVIVQIADLPLRAGRSAYVVGDVIEGGAPARIALAWHDAPGGLRAGDVWRMTLAIVPMQRTANPGDADSSRWWYSRGIANRATVSAAQGPLAGHRSPMLLRLRDDVAAFIRSALPDHPHSGVLQALAVGDRGGLSTAERDLLRDTGTAHLMAISGLHLGLVAGWLALLSAGLLTVSAPWLLVRVPRMVCCGISALAGAGGYTLLAGAGLPTVRALLMVGVAIAALTLRHRIRPERALLVAAVVLLIIDPAAPLTAGFWLSFMAVGIIFLTLRLGSSPSPWVLALRVQLVLSIMMAPLAGVLFGYWQPAAALANLVAVPWVSLTTVPLTLLAVVVLPLDAGLSAALLAVAAATVDGLWPWLVWCRGLADPWPMAHMSLPAALLAGAGLLGAVTLDGVCRRSAALILCLPMIWPQIETPSVGEAWVDVMDVGEGLSVLVRTRRHALLYDTGPGAFWGADAGERIVVPGLRALGVRRLDALVVSHDDFQHRGGVRSVLAAIAVDRRWTADPANVPIPSVSACTAGTAWAWDEVNFAFLAPDASGPVTGDDGGCVLQVEAGGTRFLLTGDLEAPGQRRLIRRHGDALRADLLLAPHQGRRAEAGAGLLAIVRPRVVVFTTGRGNRYGYPRADTVEAYSRGDTLIADTATTGAQRWSLSAAGLRQLAFQRRDRRALWLPAVQPMDEFLYDSARQP